LGTQRRLPEPPDPLRVGGVEDEVLEQHARKPRAARPLWGR
jgi:hypothetical protein